MPIFLALLSWCLSLLDIYNGPLQLSKLDQSLASDVVFAAESYNEFHPGGLFPWMISEEWGREIIFEKELLVLLYVLALHWLVAAENVTSKDELSSHTLNKFLDMQRTH